MWTIIHGQTFSLVSIACNFYLAPRILRKPLSQLRKIKQPLSHQTKKAFFPPIKIIKDSITLIKVVTYRQPNQSIASRWNSLPLTKNHLDTWISLIQDQKLTKIFAEYWNDLVEIIYRTNYARSQNGLFNLHCFMPHQLPMSLNI